MLAIRPKVRKYDSGMESKIHILAENLSSTKCGLKVNNKNWEIIDILPNFISCRNCSGDKNFFSRD